MQAQPSCSGEPVAGRAPEKVARRAAGAKRSRRERGQAVVETAFLVPWIFFLFVGVMDLGFYCFALMATSNAARVAAIELSGAWTPAATIRTSACPIVLGEMQSLPNVYSNFSTCGSTVSITADCKVYTLGSSTGASGCTGALCGPTANCTNIIQVTYTTVPLIPIPGILPNRFTFIQKAEVQFGV